jgi:RNA polymerase sigma-70 factor (ECF subfamily)
VAGFRCLPTTAGGILPDTHKSDWKAVLGGAESVADVETTTSTFLGGLNDGDPEAWQRFYDRYEPMLLAMARRAGLREEDARDVVQEVLTTAFVEGFRAGKYDRERGRLRSWLRGIVANKIREARRRVTRPEVQMTDQSDATRCLNGIADDRKLPDLFDEEWERAVLAECLRRVKLEVDPKTFQAFHLYAMAGWQPEKVAAQLGIARETVYVHKSRVLARLKELQREIAEDW